MRQDPAALASLRLSILAGVVVSEKALGQVPLSQILDCKVLKLSIILQRLLQAVSESVDELARVRLRLLRVGLRCIHRSLPRGGRSRPDFVVEGDEVLVEKVERSGLLDCSAGLDPKLRPDERSNADAS